MKNTAFFVVANNLLQDRRSKMEQREKVLTDTHAQLIALLLRTYLTSKDQHALDEMFFLFFGVRFTEFYDKVNLEIFSQHMAAELEEFEKIQRMTVEEYYYHHFMPMPVNVSEGIKRHMLYPVEYNKAWPAEYYDGYQNRKPDFPAIKNPDPRAGTYGFSGTDEYPDRIDLAIEYMKSPEHLESVEAEEAQRYPEFKIAEEMALPMEAFNNSGWPGIHFPRMDQPELNEQKIAEMLMVPKEMFGYEQAIGKPEFDIAMKKLVVKPKINGDNEVILERIEQLKRKRISLLKLPKEKRGELQQTIDMINRLKTWLN